MAYEREIGGAEAQAVRSARRGRGALARRPRQVPGALAVVQHATRNGGYQQRSSRSHCRSTVAGQTTTDGRNLREWCRPARNAATCAAPGCGGSGCAAAGRDLPAACRAGVRACQGSSPCSCGGACACAAQLRGATWGAAAFHACNVSLSDEGCLIQFIQAKGQLRVLMGFVW